MSDVHRDSSEAGSPDADALTRLIERSAQGDDAARDELIARLYDEFRGMARGHMRGERDDHTLSATALVSEAYLKLFRPMGSVGPPPMYADRRSFFAAASTAMRRVLIDHARAKNALKRSPASQRTGRGFECVAPDAVAAAATLDPGAFLAIDEAIGRLEHIDERAAQVMRLRFFGGQSLEVIADLLDVSSRTVRRDWEFARAWLHENLGEGPES
ncbi:MAG: sigma-70 family RNA polymerase sigma factor [Phycisphaerales bacterium]|nr:sigma-70 family RNA polymerase sigma factor [Phycisphaerales bacterium]